MQYSIVPVAALCCFPLAVRADIADVRVVQTGFSFRSDGSADTPRVVITWSEAGGSPASVDILRDGEVLAQLEAATETGLRGFDLEDEPLGEHLYEVAGSDGSSGGQIQTVIASSPVGDAYNLTCASESESCALSGDDEACDIIIIWDNDGPFEGSYNVSIANQSELVFPMDPAASCATVTADAPGEVDVAVYAFAEGTPSGEPGNYRSAIAQTTCLVECTPPANSFHHGVCDGVGDSPTLTSAVFGLNFLFLGGDSPPCREACDADQDGEFVLSDMIYVLNFLFLGGSAPSGWVDGDADGTPDPTCGTAPLERCAEAHAEC